MSDGIPGKVTETSLSLNAGLSMKEWAEAGELIGTFHRGSPWWIGDWLVYGEDHYGEKHAQYVEETGLSVKALVARARLSRQIPPERRRETLSLSHHQAVLLLLPEQQEALLAAADREGWTSARLREEARRTNHRPESDRPSLGDLGDRLATAAETFLQALDAPPDETTVPLLRTDLIAAIAAWQDRRE